MNARIVSLAALASPFVLALACVQDVSAGKATAAVVEPEVAAVARGRDLVVDKARSEVRALGAKLTAKHPIVFDTWKGSLRVDGDQLVGVDVVIEMDSLRADVDKLTGHLKTEDFFDVATFPKATFASTRVVATPGAAGATHEVSGALTLHGVTKHVRFPATVSWSGEEVLARAEFVIDRQDFGIAYPGMPDDLIQDDVLLTIDLKG